MHGEFMGLVQTCYLLLIKLEQLQPRKQLTEFVHLSNVFENVCTNTPWHQQSYLGFIAIWDHCYLGMISIWGLWLFGIVAIWGSMLFGIISIGG